MKKYITTTEVKAEPMTMGEAYNLHLLKEKVSECETDRAGYLVEHNDGSRHWCTKENFEKEYKASETFLDRLYIERDDLEEKIYKLEKFTYGTFRELTGEKRLLLLQQLCMMNAYATALRERIAFENKQPC